MEHNTMKVYIKNVYGKQMIYPLCRKAQILCLNTGKATFGEFYTDMYDENGEICGTNINKQLPWVNEIGFNVVLGHEFEKDTL